MHAPLPDALAKLSEDHLKFRRVLNVLDRQTEIIAQFRPPDLDALMDSTDYMSSLPVRHHHDLEEAIYDVLAVRSPELARKSLGMREQHQQAAQRLSVFSAAVRGLAAEFEISRKAFCETARDFIKFERDHIRAEESYFFPAALENLSQDDWETIDRDLRALEAKPDYRDATGRFKRLLETITSY